MERIGDDPIITRIMQTGYGYDTKWPVCPVCGRECDTVYKDKYGEIFGCDDCVKFADAWEEEDCFPENDFGFGGEIDDD